MIAPGRALVFSLVIASAAGVSAGRLSCPPAAPQAHGNETATQFYLRWRSTALAAKSMAEITPFWTEEVADQFSMEPEAAKADTLPMLKRLYGAQTDVKVVKETATPTGATLSLEARDGEQKPIVSSVEIVKEQGAWKMTGAVEQWKPKEGVSHDTPPGDIADQVSMPRQGTSVTYGPSSNPTHITANRISYDEARRTSYARGNVRIVSDASTITADEADVHLLNFSPVSRVSVDLRGNVRVVIAPPAR